MAVEDAIPTYQQIPWQNRDRLVPTRTYCGRVVYDRAVPHYFTTDRVEKILDGYFLRTPPVEPHEDKWERIYRAAWRCFAGSAIPFPADWDRPLLDTLKWAIVNSFIMLQDPARYLRQKMWELVLALADLYDLEDDLRQLYGGKVQ